MWGRPRIMGPAAAFVALLAGCGSHDRPATTTPQGGSRSADEQLVRTALTARVLRRGVRNPELSCKALSPRRFDCTVNFSEDWEAVIIRDRSVRLRLVGSE